MLRTLLPLVVVASSGCLHIGAELPGVLDLRSDGAEASTLTTELPAGDAVNRAGFSGILLGDGATAAGEKASVVDRQHYLIDLVQLTDGPKDELAAGVGKDAWRDVFVGDQFSLPDFGELLVKSYCTFGIGVFANGTWDFKATGTRIQTALAADAAPASPDAAAAPAPSAP